MRIPMDAIGALHGLYVKIGAHGKVFYLNSEGEWMKSEKDAQIVRAELSRKKNRFDLED